MSYSDIKYKPITNKATAERFKNGTTIHMLETDSFTGEHFENLCNAISGKSTGACSNEYDRVWFDENSKVFLSMPVSAVKTGFPLQLYTYENTVGFGIDPAKAKFSYIDIADAHSHIDIANKTINIKKHTRNNGEDFLKINKINFGTDTKTLNDEVIEFPAIRDAKTEKALRFFFNNDFFNVYSQGHKPGSEEFKKIFFDIKSRAGNNPHPFLKSGIGLMNELGLNVPIDSITEIVFSKPKVGSAVSYNFGSADDVDIGVCTSYLLQQVFKDRAARELPIVHYDADEKTMTMQVREMDVDIKYIQRGLKEIKGMQKVFEKHLGEERTNNLLLGKVDFGRDS